MFSFLGNYLYWILLVVILVITGVVTVKSFSRGVITKRPGSVALNNLLILIGLGLLLVVLIEYSWLAAIVTVIAALIVMGLGGRVVERRMVLGPNGTSESLTDYLKQNIQGLDIGDDLLGKLVGEYKDLGVVVEPLRKKMSDDEIRSLYAMITCSHEFLDEDKAVAYFALDAILDGSFPPTDALATLEKAFGPEFVKSIVEKDAELRTKQ
jgi:hypothetical protein